MDILILAVVIALVAVGAISGLVVSSRKKKQLPPPPPPSTPTITAPPAEPQVGEDAVETAEEPRRTIEEVGLPQAEAPVEAPAAEPAVEPEAPAAPAIEVPEPTAGRLVRLRARLARSQNSLGKGLLTLLSREHLDEDTWEEIEETLLVADVASCPPRSSSTGSASGSRCSAPALRRTCAPCSRRSC